MASRKKSKILQKYEEQHKEERAQFWLRFSAELDRLQHLYGVTATELAEGLDISRQRFYDFRSTPEKGLPLDQTSLHILWEWLTNPEALEERRMSAENKKNRQALRQKGINSLLKAAGFLTPISDPALQVEQQKAPKIDSSLQRVEARLSSPWIKDGIRRAQIIDTLLDEVKNQGRLDQTLHTQPISAKDALNWLTNPPLEVNDPILIDAYRKTIRRLARSGKNQFLGVELFELYQSLQEYQLIDNYDGAQVNIIDCQFPILSAQFPKSVQTELKPFISIYQEAENALINLLSELDALDKPKAETDPTALFPPVVRAEIQSKFENAIENITWRYSSTGTHLENMLAAIKNGLGHPLQMTGFSIQATGTSARSLARVSIGLAERDQDGNISHVYQGWWVDSNAITAVLIATILATKDWLSSHGADLRQYFNICNQLGNIDNQLYHIRENVQEYFFRPTDSHLQDSEFIDNQSVFDTVEAQIKAIEKLLSTEQLQSQPYYKTRHQALKNRYHKSKLTRMRLDLKNSEVGKANTHLDEAKSFIQNYEYNNLPLSENESAEDAYRHILFLHASECVMLYNFYAGDREFLTGKLWRYRERYRVDNGLKKLGKYLKAVGSINFDAFSWASQLFGVTGLLELYMAQEKDVEFLTKAAKYLLWAAHYSQRIGYIRRSIYWLTHASRVYCRLGELETSEQLSKIVDVSAHAVHQTYEEESEYDSKFKHFITATIHLAEGERLLAIEDQKRSIEDYKRSKDSFLRALEIFIEIHYADRLTADALYGLYRASKNIEGEIDDAFSGLKCNDKHGQLDEGMLAILQAIIQSLQQIDPKSSWKSTSSTFKDLAKQVWHHWAEVGNELSDIHPIEEAMDRDRFLAVVSRSD